VLVSLVRNNGHGIPAKALGFLRDDRRMNVLLSRAKWRMILVGSLRFYQSVLEISKRLPDADIGFLERFLTSLDEAKRAGDASIVPWSPPTRSDR
jgi:superfamily I DNA and/or RNA helicase